MKKSDLAQVQKLAAALSPEDRLLLWNYLSDLPDSGINNLDISKPTQTLDGSEPEVETETGERYVLVTIDNYAMVWQKKRLVFQVTFHPQNYYTSQLEIHSWNDAALTEEAKNQIREIFRLYGKPEPDEAAILAACKESSTQVCEARTKRMTNEILARLPHMAAMLFDGGTRVVELAVDNDIAEKLGGRKKTLDEIGTQLEPLWNRIKAHFNLTPGGRQNVKHQWSLVDHTCLALNYDRLKPIWREAKKTAKDALNSNEATRRKNWKAQVTAAYSDEDLPIDLVEQLAPMINAQPANLALLHASRLCIPVSLSIKTLKEKLRQFNPTPRASKKNTKNEGSS